MAHIDQRNQTIAVGPKHKELQKGDSWVNQQLAKVGRSFEQIDNLDKQTDKQLSAANTDIGGAIEMLRGDLARTNGRITGCAEVASQQTALALLHAHGALKANPGQVDGIWGKQTANARSEFQKASGVKTGKETVEMLIGALEKIQGIEPVTKQGTAESTPKAAHEAAPEPSAEPKGRRVFITRPGQEPRNPAGSELSSAPSGKTEFPQVANQDELGRSQPQGQGDVVQQKPMPFADQSISQTREGLLHRVASWLRPSTEATKAKASNIMAIAEETGRSRPDVETNYDKLTQPTVTGSDLVNLGLGAAAAAGAAVSLPATAAAAAIYGTLHSGVDAACEWGAKQLPYLPNQSPDARGFSRLLPNNASDNAKFGAKVAETATLIQGTRGVGRIIANMLPSMEPVSASAQVAGRKLGSVEQPLISDNAPVAQAVRPGPHNGKSQALVMPEPAAAGRATPPAPEPTPTPEPTAPPSSGQWVKGEETVTLGGNVYRTDTFVPNSRLSNSGTSASNGASSSVKLDSGLDVPPGATPVEGVIPQADGGQLKVSGYNFGNADRNGFHYTYEPVPPRK